MTGAGSGQSGAIASRADVHVARTQWCAVSRSKICLDPMDSLAHRASAKTRGDTPHGSLANYRAAYECDVALPICLGGGACSTPRSSRETKNSRFIKQILIIPLANPMPSC